MKPLYCLLMALFILSIRMSLAQCSRQEVESRRKIAFVIGNARYSSMLRLPNAVNDANDISRALKRLNFEVLVDSNLDARSLRATLDKWTDKLSNTDLALFFYAGHGVQINGENYLLPIDANTNSYENIKSKGYQASELVKNMQNENPNLNIIILDACRENPIPRSVKYPALEKGMSKMSPKGNSMMICFPTEEGKTTADNLYSFSNGIYTSALLKYIERPNITLQEIFLHVKDDVSERTGNLQNPCVYYSLGSKYNYCLKFQENSVDNYSDSVNHSRIERFRAMPPSRDMASNKQFKFLIDTFQQIVAQQIQMIKDSLPVDLTSTQTGYSVQYENKTFTNCIGIQQEFSSERLILPKFDLILRGQTLVITIQQVNNYLLNTGRENLLEKFENEHHLQKLISKEYSAVHVDWKDISALIRSYFSQRIEILR